MKNYLVVFMSLLLLASCTGYERVLKSNDVNYKLKKANEYFEKKKYSQANQLYESLIPVMKQTRNYEPLYYRYAYTFYYLKDYLSASYHFKNFFDFFPSSKDAEECEFLYGYCLYKESPKSSLDQTYTIKAVEALQSFINVHPQSKKVSEASKIISDCRTKLETKDAAAAKLYYNIGQYKASGVAYQMVTRNYLSSTKIDYYQYMIVKSWFNYAKASVKSKQEERFATAIEAYKELVDTYPKSQYLREAEEYNTQAENYIKKIRDEHK
ncbi:MAG: outer membrane protein assembly factor BamD [Flavipsychrobacter sp.]